MSIEAALRTRLKAFAGVATLVGERIYPAPLPQQQSTGTWLPAVSYSVTTERRQNTFRGPTGLPGTLFAIDCWAVEPDDAKALATQVRLALDGFQGTSQGETIQCSSLEDQQDFYESEANVHRRALDVRIWWNEPQS